MDSIEIIQERKLAVYVKSNLRSRLHQWQSLAQGEDFDGLYHHEVLLDTHCLQLIFVSRTNLKPES